MPSFAISEGLVVTPSRIPRSLASLIWSRLAVSMKNFMVFLFFAAAKVSAGFIRSKRSSEQGLNERVHLHHAKFRIAKDIFPTADHHARAAHCRLFNAERELRQGVGRYYYRHCA